MIGSRIPSVSVVLHRGGASEVYLARRHPSLRFFGGFWAFPGGKLLAGGEAHDRVEEAADPTLPAAALAGAARELLEELGLDLAGLGRERAGRLCDLLSEDESAFAATLRAEGRILARRGWRRLARLLTPAFHPRRFDTLFVALDLEQHRDAGEPRVLEGELVDGGWDAPRGWLARWSRGEILLAPPVLLLLRILDRHGLEAAGPALTRLEEGSARGRIPPIFHRPGVQLLPLRTPTLPPATHTNAYLVGAGPCYLVDPATPHPDEQARLHEALEEAAEEGRRPTAILLSHHHDDHVGAVEAVRRRWQVPVWAHAATAARLEGRVPVDRVLAEGDRLPLGERPDGKGAWELLCLHTPGHAPGHLCFYEEAQNSLLAGDMVSTLSSILIDPRDGDMGHYLDSLRRLLRLPVEVLHPSHGPPTAGGARLLAAQLEHRLDRERAILACLREGESAVPRIVARVYADVDPALHSYATLSVRSHLARLRATGRLDPEGEA